MRHNDTSIVHNSVSGLITTRQLLITACQVTFQCVSLHFSKSNYKFLPHLNPPNEIDRKIVLKERENNPKFRRSFEEDVKKITGWIIKFIARRRAGVGVESFGSAAHCARPFCR